MFITSNYEIIKKGTYKYAFFLNYKDDYEKQRDFVKELNILIERFSEELDKYGLIVKSYNSTIKSVRKEILDKPWPKYRIETIKKTPGMLMIDTDFAEFNPNKNNWIYFYFIRDQRFKKNRGNSFTIEEAEELFEKLAEMIIEGKENIFKEVKTMLRTKKVKKITGKVGEVIGQEMINYGIALSAEKLLELINKKT